MGKDKNVSENIRSHKNEKLILEEQDIEGDHRNLRDKNFNTRSHIKKGLVKCIFQAGLLRNKLLSSLKEIRFSD